MLKLHQREETEMRSDVQNYDNALQTYNDVDEPALPTTEVTAPGPVLLQLQRHIAERRMRRRQRVRRVYSWQLRIPFMLIVVLTALLSIAVVVLSALSIEQLTPYMSTHQRSEANPFARLVLGTHVPCIAESCITFSTMVVLIVLCLFFPPLVFQTSGRWRLEGITTLLVLLSFTSIYSTAIFFMGLVSKQLPFPGIGIGAIPLARSFCIFAIVVLVSISH